MIHTKFAPAVHKAFDFIKDKIDKGELQAGESLPASRKLADVAGVSAKSMIKAIALLKAKGLVSGVERGRIKIGQDSSGNLPSFVPEDAVWRMKRTALEKDVLAGVYADKDRLGSLKELQSRYGTCYRTMRKILRSMIVDGVVRLQGRTYVLHKISDESSSRRIVFITYQIQALPRSALNQGNYQVLGLLERECMQKGFELEILIIDFYNPAETHRALAGPVIGKSAMGYVLDLWWYPGEEFRGAHIDLLQRLSLFSKPVTILDEIGDFALPLPFVANPLFQVFRIEGRKAGGRVARLLLSLGHRSIAYISQMHAFFYSQQRLKGIIEQYSAAGCKEGLRPVVNDKLDIGFMHILAISGFDDRLLRKVTGVYRTESQAEDQFQQFMQFKKNPPSQPISTEDIRMIQKELAVIIDIEKQDLDRQSFDRICTACLAGAGSRLFSIVLLPLFEQALRDKNLTAWICANDGIALAALAFLRNRNIPVPGRLSIVGFDNEPVEAVEQRLTTFDFNTPGFIHGMLNFIARPPIPRGKYHHSPIEVEGIVMQRETTGRIQKGSR